MMAKAIKIILNFIDMDMMMIESSGVDQFNIIESKVRSVCSVLECLEVLITFQLPNIEIRITCHNI